MTSKFERDLLLPAFARVELARDIEEEAGTSHRLGFERGPGDVRMASYVAATMAGHGEISDGLALLNHALLRWYDGGCPRFRLTHGLTTELVLTDPTGVPMSEVRQPFPTYVVELPKPNGPIVLEGKYGDAEPSYLIIHSNLVGGERERPTNSTLMKRGMRSTFDTITSWRSDPDLREHLSFHLLDGMQSMTVMQHGLFVDADVIDARHVPVGEIGDGAPVETSDVAAIALCMRIAFNLPLYLRHRPSASTTSGKTVNHDHGIRSTLYELGADVRLDQNLRNAARAACLSGRDPAAWKLATRFIVRGHWKNQPHGPGRTERKLIFVQPYWKGDASDPLVARAYADRR